ncbi:ABC transporter substrate-binding protein [Treponema sp. R6D11]
MKKIICLILLITAAIPFVFASGGSDTGSKNKIVIYTSMYQDVIDSVKVELKKKFPKYNIEFVYGGTGTLENKISTERSNGRLGCDILMTADPAYSLELKEKEMLHPFISKEAANLAFDYDPEGYWYPVRISNMVLAYNPEKFSKNTLPDSFRSFAFDSKIAGAISMRNPLVSGTTMAAVTALRDKYSYDYFEALGKQRVKIDYGSDETIRKLESGECKIVMILEEAILSIREKNKSKLEVIYPTDGTVVIPSPIMIINSKWSANKNTKAAEEISNWFLSADGQNAIVSGWMHSVRTDFDKIPYDSKPINEIRSNSIPVIWENVYKQRKEILSKFEQYLAGRK